jgi:hypothetical protein
MQSGSPAHSLSHVRSQELAGEVGAAVAVAVATPVAAGAPTCRQWPSEACSQTVSDVCDERSCVTWSQVSATPMGQRTSVQRHSRSMTAPA